MTRRERLISQLDQRLAQFYIKKDLDHDTKQLLWECADYLLHHCKEQVKP